MPFSPTRRLDGKSNRNFPTYFGLIGILILNFLDEIKLDFLVEKSGGSIWTAEYIIIG